LKQSPQLEILGGWKEKHQRNTWVSEDPPGVIQNSDATDWNQQKIRAFNRHQNCGALKHQNRGSKWGRPSQSGMYITDCEGIQANLGENDRRPKTDRNHWENDEKLVERQEFEWKFHPGSVVHCCSIFGPELMTYLKKQCT